MSRPSHSCQSQNPLDSQCAGAVLLAGYVPHRAKPQHQPLTSVLKNSAGGHRRLTSTGTALQQCATDTHRSPALTMWATESVGPAQLFQVCPARLLSRKPIFELLDGPWIIFHNRNLQVGV